MWQPRRRRPPACPQASPVPSCYEASPGKGGQGTGPAHSRPLRAEGLGRCAPRGGQPLPDVAGHGPGRLHSCTVRSRLPAPLSRNHLNAPSDASLSGCHHGVTGPLGCHWRCLPGTGRPGCLGASHHSAGLNSPPDVTQRSSASGGNEARAPWSTSGATAPSADRCPGRRKHGRRNASPPESEILKNNRWHLLRRS